MGSIRRARELADIAPQYIAKSGLCNASELESSKLGSIKIQHVTGLANASEGKSRFPKLDECAHFHYEHVEIGPLKVSIINDDNLKPLSNESDDEKWWSLSVESQNKTWLIRRSYDNFRMLDQQLHRCIYDRKFSELSELPSDCIEDQENIHKLLGDYMKRFSAIAGNIINCGPILNWLELDNRGHRLLVPDNDNCPINTPAVAAAYSVKRYTAQAPDEISFEVGDMISVIDMPPPEESIWWHGKRGFQVGFFPCECVAVIGDKVPRNLHFSPQTSLPTKPVLRKHGKLIAFFRSFILSRPSRRRLKQSGILRERVFGCDLGEHLLNSGHEIPVVLKCCVEFIESHGLVDGIYRLSGVTSNIQKLRNAFDEDRVPALYEDESILQDVHSVASLLKMYFRELPNPLCTYQLYHQFVGAVQATQGDDTRLLKMRDVVQKLPPPHYRTLEYLMRHLARVSEKGHETGMTSRNVAIVWAPNLLRCKELEVGGVAALQGVGVQAVVTEFLVCYADLIFCDRLPNFSLPPQQVCTKKCRPKSLAISTPTKLLSLEEARTRALLQASGKTEPEYIEVGGGPANLPAKYHTVIELPGYSRKRMGSKRSPIGWKMLFGGKSGRSSQSRKDIENKTSKSSDVTVITTTKAMTESDLARTRRHLRPAKSAESLNSSRNSEMADVVDTVLTGSIEDSLSPMLLRSCEGKANGHNRSVSHESYFDQLQDHKDNLALDISEIQVNFDLEESEMRIFSEDETIMSNGSGSLASNTSPRILGSQKKGKLTQGSSVKRLSYPKLTTAADEFDNVQNTDPSPKKQKTNDESSPMSKLEEQLSSSVGDIQFIDSVSPDQTLAQNDVHLIQSPSPVSSISQLSSSLLAPSSPILPHIPHLMKHFIEAVNSHNRDKDKNLIVDHQSSDDVEGQFSLDNAFSMMHSARPHSVAEVDAFTCVKNLEEGLESGVSDRESSDNLTTPETPVCSTYTPLIEFEESSLSNKTTPDAVDTGVSIGKSSSDNLDTAVTGSCAGFDICDYVGKEVENIDEKNCRESSRVKEDNKPHRELITYDMVKLDKLKTDEELCPKPEERKPRMVHPYVNIPLVSPKTEVPKVLETSFDEEPITTVENSNFTVAYQGFSTESSSDSLVNVNKDDEYMLPLNSRPRSESSSVECRNSNSSVEESVKTELERFSSEASYVHGDTNAFSDNFQNGRREVTADDKEQLSGSPWIADGDDGSAVGRTSSLDAEEAESERSTTPDKIESSMGCDFGIETNFNFGGEIQKDVEPSESSTDFASADIEIRKCQNDSKECDQTTPSHGKRQSEDESREKEEKSNGETGETPRTEMHQEFDADSANRNFVPFGTVLTKQWKGGLLETDLDAPDCSPESGSVTEANDGKVDDVSPAGGESPKPETSCGGSVRELLTKFELSPTKEIRIELGTGNEDSICVEGGSRQLESSQEKQGTGRGRGGGEGEDRPKTLERLSTRRRAEKDSFELSKIQLGKSKSGSHINDKSPDCEKVDILLNCDFDLSDPQRRERIEKYKEKRRNYLREKYRSDSFKNEKDDFVLKIKQKHLRKGDRGDGSHVATSEKASGARPPASHCGGGSPEKRDKPSGQRLWKASDSTDKDPGQKSFAAEVPGRSRIEQPIVSSSLRESQQSNKKNNFAMLCGERRTGSEIKSARNSVEKKNNFLSFSLGGSTKEEGHHQQSPSGNRTSRKAIEPGLMTGMEAGVSRSNKSSSSSSGFAKQRGENSKIENPQSPMSCIKDMTAIFEGRNDCSEPAKQYLSSV